MNYRTSITQKSNNWRASSDGSAAHKLLSIELDHHREIQSLLREIKRLRSEVGLMARLRNFHKAQTDRLADILRKLPPPDIPTRNTPKVAEPPNPQNDTTMEERGRPKTRGGSGSDKSTSREDGKQRTKEKGKDREEDKPMIDVCDHIIGENRNDTSSTRPKATTIMPATRMLEDQTVHCRSVSRHRAVSVVAVLRTTRSNTKSPAPRPKEDLTKAKKDRRRDKERQKTKQIAADEKEKEEKERKEKEEKVKKEKEEKEKKEKERKEKEEKEKKEKEEKEKEMARRFNRWTDLACDLEELLGARVKNIPRINKITNIMNRINDRWDTVGTRVVEREDFGMGKLQE